MVAQWRQRQKEELHRLLYEGALELFAVQGYEATTVQQITEAVGVAKGTFFNHFPTKEHVIAEWYHGITRDALEAARARATDGAEDAVIQLCVDMARRAAAAPELLEAKSQHSADPLLVEAERVQDEEMDVFLRARCAAGQQQGELQPDLDLEFFIGLLGVVLTGSSRAWVSSSPRPDFPAVVEERLRFLFQAARPGRR